jgi:hypothetical protein
MATQITILDKFRYEDNLVTQVQYDFDAEINDSIVVNIYHFRPKTELEVEQNIIKRGESEKAKIMAQNLIDQILPNINV